MELDEFLAVSEGEALHFSDPSKIPWSNLGAAKSFNELAHLVQYRWFREVIAGSGLVGRHLDVACGSGYGTAMLSESSSIEGSFGVDLNKRHIEYARKHFSQVNFLTGDCERLDALFSDSEFAFVTSAQTIEHVINPVAFVRGIVRVLRHDGIFLLMTPTHNRKPQALHPKNPWHIFEFNPTFLEKLLLFFFDDVRMGQRRPCPEVFDELSNVVGRNVSVPIADATYCALPKKNLNSEVIDQFQNEYLLSFYAEIVQQVQGRLIDERRRKHFLRESYNVIDFLDGFYAAEIDKIWTMPEATFLLRPLRPKGAVRLGFSVGGGRASCRVMFKWDNREKNLLIKNSKLQTIQFDNLTSPLQVKIKVAPSFRPSTLGGIDMRELGIAITSVEPLS